MTDNPPTPPPAPAPDPAATAAVAAAGGATPDQARTEVAATQTAAGVSEADANRIADATIARLEARGAFGDPGTSTPAAAGESPIEETEVDPNAGPPTGPNGDSPPRKRSLAERFVGRR